MRPIQLQMSGLQSYRELQTIDFAGLIDAGVFGIFGPTGSGKSSILDAITLSLYGKVERASGGTQAIMNHAEQTLFVAFTFELTNAAGTERYRVERQFKRGSEMSINGTIARLLHLGESETIVLADKAGEVNQKVLHILGLSMQDFTRAVVLPQGKFAEFLTLTGKDRRQMLQRLFHLEQYGDHLSAKVSAKVKETDSAVKQLAAEQTGLGDASEQALQEANDRLREAEQETVRSRRHLEVQEKLHEEHKQIFQWQQEKTVLENEARRLDEQEPLIRQKELLLGQADKAERVRPYLEQQDSASKDVLGAQAQLSSAASSGQTADARFSQAAESFERAQQELAAQEGPLLLRLDQLQQALLIQQELEQVQQHIQTSQRQEQEVKAALAGKQAEIARTNETKQKALLKQADLKEQLKQAETNTAARQLMQAAHQEKQAIRQLQDQLSQALQVKEARARALSELDRSLLQHEAKGQALQHQAGEWLRQSEATRGQGVKRYEAIQSLIPRVEAQLEQLKISWKMQERHALAAILADELADGEHCPVCGSTEHPGKGKVSSGPHTGDELEKQIQQAERLLQLIKERLYTQEQRMNRMHAVHRQAVDLAEQVSRFAHAAKVEQAANLSELEAAAAIDEMTLPSGSVRQEGMQTLHNIWEYMEKALLSWGTAADALEQSIQVLLKEHTAYEQQYVQTTAQQRAAASLLAEADAQVSAVQGAVTERTTGWQQRYPEFTWASIDEQLQELLAKERLAEELRGRIERSIPFLEQVAAQLEELQRAAAEHDRTALQLHERLQGLAQLAADKSRQLAQRAPGAAVPQLIAEASSALEKLRLAAQQTKLAHAEAQREQSLAAQRLSAAAEAAAAAERQLAQAERALHSALGESGFASREAAAAAALAPEQRREWTQLAAEHREREQALRAQLAQLAAKLQGRVLSADAWAQTQAELAAAKGAAEAALEARARAAQGAGELASRHARWCELEAQRAEQAKQLERLGKLQAVLKANAFVEYLAEEQLMQVSRAASERLGELTRRRYAIEVDSGGGFVIRDDANGGVKRPVSTLSGGETFLTSLALALALSAQIQLKGEYPLEFFFLDEGFGTLDQELLDMVIGALEKLHMDSLAVGVISHVPELRARLARKLIVQPAEPSGRGSRIVMEEQ
ncbi:SMC family ATPase [Bacillus sp. 3255]|uniref:SMC family ATPase n=1 Tax=Bacillus sp. 3255 TaxID=2817904 RepID=UPI002857EB1C|nr:SMC family ATPase [Bacillus sp. 3255]MDR6880084.1 exonuclease SbcC [Bacillus sp. 3255]